MWRTAVRIRTGLRRAYQLMAAGVQVTAGTVAAATWLPDGVASIVAGLGFTAAIVLFGLALLRMPDSVWDGPAVERRLVDGAFVGLSLLFAFWLVIGRPGSPTSSGA
ncbi:hypothetical protein GCM10029992_31280 [Glycomyces albus]